MLQLVAEPAFITGGNQSVAKARQSVSDGNYLKKSPL